MVLLQPKEFENFTIECADRYDGDLVAVVMSNLMRDIYGDDFALNENEVHKACQGMLDNDYQHIYAILAFDTHKVPVGAMMINEGSAIYANGRVGVVTEFVIVTHMRSQGLGEMMVDYAYDLAKKLFWSRLAIIVPGGIGNRGRVMRYFKRHGFRHHGAVLEREIA